MQICPKYHQKSAFGSVRLVKSLEIRPLAALYTSPPHIFFQTDTIERGMSIPPQATTESVYQEQSSRLHPYKALFWYGVGYNAARGLISRDITNYRNNYLVIFLHLILNDNFLSLSECQELLPSLEVMLNRHFFLVFLLTRKFFKGLFLMIKYFFPSKQLINLRD